jgi:transposase
MIKHSEEFKREAVRIALTSGLPRERVAADLGIGNERLRLESLVLKGERDILKNHAALREPTAVRFAFVAHATCLPACANRYGGAGPYPGTV